MSRVFSLRLTPQEAAGLSRLAEIEKADSVSDLLRHGLRLLLANRGIPVEPDVQEAMGVVLGSRTARQSAEALAEYERATRREAGRRRASARR
jgi:Arc/MetJ-type ribon-helix-helix transcriptional regulator